MENNVSIDISIAIPYYNKPYEIKLVLKALSLQEYDKERFEVVIIDDGSDENLNEVIKSYENIINLKYKYYDHIGVRGHVRNRAARECSGKKIIFIDSDMVPDRNFINECDSFTKDDPLSVCLGMRVCLNDYDKEYINEEIIEHDFNIFENLSGFKDERTMVLVHEDRTNEKFLENWRFLYSHSFCVDRETFWKVGGFDAEFSENWGAEDIELGYRLHLTGCNLKMNPKVRCFHIEHPADISTKIGSLKDNYKILIKKHSHWDVELFTREFETWAIEQIPLQQKIRNRDFLIEVNEDINELINKIPQNTLLVGIENEELLKCNKINRAFLPESNIKSEKIDNIIGFDTVLDNNSFEIALISEKYKQINYGLFKMLFDEINRISKKVIIINEERDIIDQINDKVKIKSKNKKHLLFNLSNDMHFNFTKYYFVELAISAHKHGIKTGIQLACDPWNDLPINSGFLQFRNQEKNDLLNKLINHEMNFIGDETPCIMDTYSSIYISRSIKKRILWEELIAYNYDKYMINNSLDTYSKVFVKRDWEYDLYKDHRQTNYLPVGIDKEKIEKVKLIKQECTNNFTFLWTDRFTSKESNLEILLESFCELFGDNKSVQLKLLFSDNYLPVNTGEKTFVNDSCYHHMCSEVNREKNIYDFNYSNLYKKYSNYENIIFHTGIYDEEEYSKEIHQADCFLHLNSRLEIFPLVLESVALGKRPIIPKDNRYEGYFDSKCCFSVETEKIPMVYSTDIVNVYDNNYRYYSLSCIKKESLKNTLNDVYKDKESIIIDTNKTKEFINEFNWMTVSDRLHSLIDNF